MAFAVSARATKPSSRCWRKRTPTSTSRGEASPCRRCQPRQCGSTSRAEASFTGSPRLTRGGGPPFVLPSAQALGGPCRGAALASAAPADGAASVVRLSMRSNDWMKAHDVQEAWVLADNPGAVAFYGVFGFQRVQRGAAVYLAREGAPFFRWSEAGGVVPPSQGGDSPPRSVWGPDPLRRPRRPSSARKSVGVRFLLRK